MQNMIASDIHLLHFQADKLTPEQIAGNSPFILVRVCKQSRIDAAFVEESGMYVFGMSKVMTEQAIVLLIVCDFCFIKADVNKLNRHDEKLELQLGKAV